MSKRGFSRFRGPSHASQHSIGDFIKDFFGTLIIFNGHDF